MGKEPVGKGGVGKAEIGGEYIDEWWPAWPGLGETIPGLGGIYLSPPAGAFTSRSVPGSPGTVTITRKVTVIRPVGVPTPVTPSDPGDG